MSYWSQSPDEYPLSTLQPSDYWTDETSVSGDVNNTDTDGTVTVFQRITSGSSFDHPAHHDALARSRNRGARLVTTYGPVYAGQCAYLYRTYCWGSIYQYRAGQAVIRNMSGHS